MIIQSINESLRLYLGVVPRIVFRFDDINKDPIKSVVYINKSISEHMISINDSVTTDIVDTILQYISSLPINHKTKHILYMFCNGNADNVTKIIRAADVDCLGIQICGRVDDDSVRQFIQTFSGNYRTTLDFNCYLHSLDHSSLISQINDRNRSLRPRAMHRYTLFCALALAHLFTIGFGPYLLLEIIDWTNPHYHMFNHRIKITVLQKVFTFMNKKYQS